MKRKRGHKKGKAKAPPVTAANPVVPNVISANTKENSHTDNDEYESGMEVDTPSSTGTDQPLNVASINPDGSIDKAAGKVVNRVKVKLKTPKMLESNMPSHSDNTDKSSPGMGFERKSGGGEKVEDSGNSSAELKMGFAGIWGTKAGSIKIKSSSMAWGGLSGDKSSNVVMAKGGESLHKKEPKTLNQETRYNKLELEEALSVIKKVMKMDAAEPFNVPVNPEALGIPDYFDVIDTPMDLGTICSNLENGDKYMNSEDVFKDVQYIWDNCYKYNSKGDYIMDLMKRVKKNFMKYWVAAGLFNDQPRETHGVENIQSPDAALSSQGKVHLKGVQLKQKSQKRHGRRHKSDCLCAICVLKRRKREREENSRISRVQIGGVDNNHAQEVKHEGSSLIGSPCGEDSSSNMDESLDGDVDAEVEGNRDEVKVEVTEQHYSPMEEKHEEEGEEDEDEEAEEEEEESEIKVQKKGEGDTKEQSQIDDRSREEPNGESQPAILGKSGAVVQDHTQRGYPLEGQHEETVTAQQQKHQDPQELQEKAKLYESFQFENPMLLSLCGVLFPDNHKSVWSGQHSLAQYQGPRRISSIHKAVETLMK
ncbi:Bromodomain domain-containing protein [Cephalotus follicularis]|uniref:Bromodomain domain-containing protein n=1 Tax=Cephalotus follicularis TaxID=3775 RepID=A0A1Q3DCN1_CEPFO|nr:Bromodomain domain-containing protein [Cephalotus follicularis]